MRGSPPAFSNYFNHWAAASGTAVVAAADVDVGVAVVS